MAIRANNLAPVIPAAMVGQNGELLTPEQIARQRELAAMLMQRGANAGPVTNIPEGLSRLVDGFASYRLGVRASQAEEANRADGANIERELFDYAGKLPIFSSSGSGVGGGGATASTGSLAASSPANPSIFSDFIDTTKSSGVTNPYALAAVAATGQAESGYDPKNAFGNWSDPSQSGQAGTAGGIMSWRAERLEGLRQFAAANGDDPNRPSPATQAKFFLQEDPSLVAALNGAKSVEEAQNAINGAWKFAGYDQPGGEAARRLGLAKGYLSRFQGGGTQVASLDPSAGMGGAGDTPWLRYANQGATRSQPLAGNLTSALGFLPEMGITAEVFSGGQPTAAEGGARTGSTRHDHGGAADMRFYRDGRQLDWANPADLPVFEEIVRRGRAAGLTGFGAGDGYMGAGTMHVGFGAPGVWGAGGRSANAPEWLRNAFEAGAAPASRPASTAPVQVASLDPSDGFTAYAPQPRSASSSQAVASALIGPATPAPLPAPRTVASNPAPPQDPMTGLDPRTSDVARALMASGSFDGFSFDGGQAGSDARQPGLAGQPSVPGAPGTAVPSVSASADYNLVILRALTSPNVSPGTRRIAELLFQQQVEQTDPVRALQLEKAQLEVQALRNPQVKPIEINGRLVDPRSGKVLADYSEPDTAVVNGTLVNTRTGQPVYQPPQQPTGNMQEYDAYAADERAAGRQPVGRLEYEQALRKSSAQTTTINTGNNSSKFIDKSDEAASARFDDIIQAGGNAAQTLGDIQQLADLGRDIGTGKIAQVKAALGPYAQALGIDIANQGEAEAYQSIIARMAPQMRPAGAGATSDFDARQFLASLPSLGNTPGGNKIITDTFAAVQQNKLQAAEIASQAYIPVDQGGITWQEAEKRIRALPNPYERFKATRERGGDGAPRSDGPATPGGATPVQRARNPKTGEILELRNGRWEAVQ